MGLSNTTYLKQKRKTRPTIKANKSKHKDIKCKLEIYNNDVVISTGGQPPELKDKWGKKTVLTHLSYKSRQRMAFTLSNTDITFKSMITLTYGAIYPRDGKRVKADLNRFLTSYIRGVEESSYFWFLEFQKRGAPHIHILKNSDYDYAQNGRISALWYSANGKLDPNNLKAGTRHEAGRSKRGLHRYGIKYATKTVQKDVPSDYGNVGRFWGCSRDVNPIAKWTGEEITYADARKIISNWEYLDKMESERTRPYRTLYNASPVR